MGIDTVIKNLHLYQKWRRGKTEEMSLSPLELGKTIDETIRLLRQLKKSKM